MKRRAFLKAVLAAGTAATAARSPGRSRGRVLIVGGGFAGSACALALRRLDPALDVVLVDPDESYATGPMSNEVLVGWRSLASITVTRRGLRAAGVRVLAGRVADIDAAAHGVRLEDGRRERYDRLVVAPGIRFLWERIVGYDAFTARSMPHAWQAGEQTSLLARRLAALPAGGVVAICVPGGLMRCPPGPYERATLIAEYLARRRPRAKVLIFDANNHFPRQDLFTEAWRSRYAGRVEWIAGTAGGSLSGVDVTRSTLHVEGGTQRVDVANVIPPQAPGLIAATAGLSAGHGWCPVDSLTFESTLSPGVHVIGDACIAGAMPKAGSAAVSQARQCAAAIVAALAGRAPPTEELTSVCFGLVARDAGLAIPARFELRAGRWSAMPAVDVAAAAQAAAGGGGHDPLWPVAGLALDRTSTAAAQAARRWYAATRAAAFAD